MKRKKEPKLPFFIGSDPEFLMFFGDRGLDASEIIKSFFRNNDKVRSANQGYQIEGIGDFGWDGASSTGELRPKATDTIQEMVNNLGTMLKTISEKMPTVDLTTLSIGSPIGGHIHVDSFLHKPGQVRNSAETARVQNLMGTFLLPLAASDHRVSALTRLRGGSYGKLTDIRYEHKVNCTTAELRGLTAEWLTTPEIAYATFAYIVTVWHELETRNLELSKLEFVTRSQEQNQTLQRMMLSDYKVLEQSICKSIRKEIRTFKLYKQYAEHIELILNPQKVMKIKAAVGWNINRGWRINKKAKVASKKALLSNTDATEALKKEKIPDIHKHFAIAYNDDFNVALFASAISERIAGLNWQLKHDYFLFGLKKGTEGFAAMAPDQNLFSASTNVPLVQTIQVLTKMQQRAKQSAFQGAKIDPKTGRIRKFGNSSQQIIIGIPYQDRSDKNTKNLIELMWRIENKKAIAQTAVASNFPVNIPVVAKNAEPNLVDIVDSDRNIDHHRYDVSSIVREISENI